MSVIIPTIEMAFFTIRMLILNKNIFIDSISIFCYNYILNENDQNITVEVNIYAKNDTVWFNQKQMAVLFEVSTDNIGLHIKNILNDNELDSSTTEEFSIIKKKGIELLKGKLKYIT